jgi:20S proteasome alpha/beta subunit
MTSIGTGYDLSASTYSPDGRIFQVLLYRSYCPLSSLYILQVEYASKAVDNSGYVLVAVF